jgi:hypothetical protein
MLQKTTAVLLLSVILAFFMALFSDIILGPVRGAQPDGHIAKTYLFSRYSVDVIVYIAGSAKSAFASPSKFFEAISSSLLLVNLLGRLTLILALSVCLSWAFLFLGKRVPDHRKHLGGMRLLSGRQAVEDAKQQFLKEIKHDRHRDLPTIYLAKDMPITPSQETRGIFIEGGVGSGKTVIIESLLLQAIKRGDKVVLYDTKGDFAPKIAKRAVLNPFAQGSVVWAIARDVKTADQARQLARMLVPADASKDDFWNNAAHSILSGIFITLQSEKPKRWTFRDVLTMLLSPRATVIEKLRLHYPTATLFFGEKNASNPEQGILATLAAKLSPFIEPLAISWGSPSGQAKGFSFESWLFSNQTMPQVVVLQGSPEHADAAAAWIRMAINYLAGVLISPRVENDGPLRLWLIVDELPSLGNVPRLTEIIDRGRQKGVRTLVAAQNLGQLALHYGDWAQSAESTFGVRIFSKMSPGERTQAIIKSLGDQQIGSLMVTKTRNVDGSTTRSERLITEKLPVLSPDIFGSLGVQTTRGVDALIVGLTSNVLRANWAFPPQRPNYHPPFKLASLDRTVLQMPTAQPAKSNVTVTKSVGLKLDDAIEAFDGS